MAKHTLKILGCSQPKIFKVWSFFNIMKERVQKNLKQFPEKKNMKEVFN